jgi:Flp pilus assembly protein TadD
MRFGVVILGLAVVSGACSSTTKPAKQAYAEMNEGVQGARRGYWQEALFRFERASTLTPGNGQILNNLAVTLEALGRYDEALAMYKQALRATPKDNIIRKNYARFAEFYTSYAKGVKPKVGPDALR